MKLNTLLVLALCSGLGSCNMTAGGVNIGAITNVGNSLTKIGTIDQSQEALLGEDFAAMLLGAAELHPDGGLQSYVNSVGRYLASQSGRPDLPWTFAVLDTPDLNAFAIPGGYVFITSGLLAHLNSEAELATVLAHEISHITARHQLKQLERDNSMNLLSHLASAVKTYRDERKSGSHISRFKNRQITESAMNAGQQLLVKGLSRDDELHADSLAIRLAARAGYDPYAMAAVLQRLDSLGSDSAGIRLILATHPAPLDRLQQIEAELLQLEQEYAKSSHPKLQLTERYLAALQAD